MFLIWGTKKSVSKLGYVAEFCPRCQDVKQVKVSRVAMVDHIFYASSGNGYLLGFFGECQQCSGQFEVEPTDYPALEKSKKTQLPALLEKTNPRLIRGNKDIIASYERFVQVREPFLRFNRSIEDRYQNGSKQDKVSGISFLLTFLLPILIGYIASRLSLETEVLDNVILMCMGLFLTGLVISVILMRTEPQRFFKRQIIPELIKSLDNVKPSEQELVDCLFKLKKLKYRIANFVTPNKQSFNMLIA